MKKVAFLALAVVAAAGCNSAATEAGEDASGDTSVRVNVPSSSTTVTPSQIRAMTSLTAATQQTWAWIQNDTLKTPLHLSAARRSTGKPILTKNADVAYATTSFLEAHKDLFKMTAPAKELTATRIESDDLGMRHARFQQVVKGVPVVGAEVQAHYDAVGRVTSIDANYMADLQDLDVTPALLTVDALTKAKAEILTTSVIDERLLDADDGKLVVYAPAVTGNQASPYMANQPARLAYQYKIRAIEAKDPAIWVTFVDAKTGAILHRYNNLQTIQGSGQGVRGDTKQFEVTQATNGFVMTDAANGVQIRTFTARQQQTTPGTVLSSTSATAWDTGVTGAGAAVDAHFNATVVFKYYKEKHARLAIDGAGGPMISTAHFGQNYDNAAWDSTGMLYGDGGATFFPLSVSLDVVGHEFTHGVTEKTSNLIYENQSGALNEAVSDIFGAFIEHSIAPDDTKNFQMGETVVRAGSPLRDMKNPASVDDPQPMHMTKFVNTQQDNGGVHINSGIINNAAYLIIQGGTNLQSRTGPQFGIGWEKSEKLWYRANTKYFTSSTTFAQAAAGVMQAAKDVGLDANETNIVDCGFKATGVVAGQCATITNPKSTTPGTEPGQTPGTTEPGAAEQDPSASAEEAEEKPAPTRRRKIITTESGGCNVGHHSSSSAPTSLFPIALAGLALLAASSRRKNQK